MRTTYRYYQAPTSIEPQRRQVVLPAFALSVPSWIGASSLLAEFPLNNDENFSFHTPIDPFGENFVVAVRWLVDTGVWARYKLFEHDDAVLSYPVYAGERIGINAVLEIWSVNSLLIPSLDDDYTLYSSVLVFPPGQNSGCGSTCQNGSEIITLAMTAPSTLPPGAACNPFCDTLCSTPDPMPVCECPTTVVESVQDGRDYPFVTFLTPSMLITLGGVTPGDALGKMFYWDSTSLAVDTGDETTTVIRPTTIGALAPGRWLQYI